MIVLACVMHFQGGGWSLRNSVRGHGTGIMPACAESSATQQILMRSPVQAHKREGSQTVVHNAPVHMSMRVDGQAAPPTHSQTEIGGSALRSLHPNRLYLSCGHSNVPIKDCGTHLVRKWRVN